MKLPGERQGLGTDQHEPATTITSFSRHRWDNDELAKDRRDGDSLKSCEIGW